MTSPIFIVGMPRSGTTLTARILGRHPHIFIPGETHFFDDIYTRCHELGNPWEIEAQERIVARLSTLYDRFNEPADQARITKLFAKPSILDELKTSSRTYGELFSCFMHVQMRDAGKIRWGNQVPKDIFHIKEILSFYPDAKFLVCVRDIRDFLLSYQNQWRKTSSEHVDRLKKLYHPIVMSLLWKGTVKQLMVVNTLVAAENLQVLRYESLVACPAETIEEVCSFLGEEYMESLLKVDTHNSSFQVEERGIFATSVGRWRQQLSAEEVYLAERIARRELDYLGYKVAQVTPHPGKLIKIGLTLPYALWQALDANRSIRGPMLSYLIRRIKAFLP
jgi:hypothetical protein